MKRPNGHNLGGPWLFNPPCPQANRSDVRGLVDPELFEGKYDSVQPSSSPPIWPAGASMAIPDAFSIEIEAGLFPLNPQLEGRHILTLDRENALVAIAGGWLGYWYSGSSNPFDWVLAYGKYNDQGLITERWWLLGLLDIFGDVAGRLGSAGYPYFFRKPVDDNRLETFTTQGTPQIFDALRRNKFTLTGSGAHSIIVAPYYP